MSQLPVALRPAWSASSFLLYAGAATVLVSLLTLLGDLGGRHGSWGLAAWAALALAILLVVAVRAERDGQFVLAGLTALVAVAVSGVLTGALLDAIGLADGAGLFDDDLQLAPLLVEVAVLTAALWAARRLRFPLLMLAATAAQVVLVLDTVAGLVGGGNWLQWAALLLGLVELGIARSLDGHEGRRPWAFWKHVAASLLIGGALVTLLDGGDLGWVLVGVASLAYVALARSFGRSVWAVVGAFGLFLVTTHFVDESDTVVDSIPFVPAQGNGDGLELWETALVYVGLGIVYAGLGRLLRQPTLHDVEAR